MANTAGRDVPRGSEMDAVGTGTGQAPHAKASAKVWLPCYGNLLSPTASVVPVEAHIAAWPVATDSVRGREGQLEEEQRSCEVGTAFATLARNSARALPQGRHLLC
jgi:hypothetical protein